LRPGAAALGPELLEPVGSADGAGAGQAVIGVGDLESGVGLSRGHAAGEVAGEERQGNWQDAVQGSFHGGLMAGTNGRVKETGDAPAQNIRRTSRRPLMTSWQEQTRVLANKKSPGCWRATGARIVVN